MGLARGVVLLLGGAFVWSVSVFAQSETPVDPGDLLFSSFSSRCRAAGPETSRALDDTKSLQGILIQIKEDKSCQGLGGLIQNIIDNRDRIEFFSFGFDGESLASLRAYERRLTVAYYQATDNPTRQSLEQEIARVRLQIEIVPYEEQERDRLRRAMSVDHLTDYLNTLSTDLPNYEMCLNRHPNIRPQIASQLLAMSGGFFDPTTHLAVFLAGSLLNSFFEYLSNISINRKIMDYRKTTLRLGLACAMEALEQTVCDVDDQARLVDKLSDISSEEELPIAWRGRDYLLHGYPVLEKFLNLVEAGSEAKSDEQGERRANFLEREGAARAAKERAVSIINGAASRLEGLRGAEQRIVFLRTVLDKISERLMRSSAYTNVIPGENSSETNSKYVRVKIWLRTGIKEPPLPQGVNNYESLYQRIDSGQEMSDRDSLRLPNPLESFMRNFQSIAADAQAQLDVERVETMNTDKQGVLASWAQITQTQDDVGTVLDEWIDYLADLELSWTSHTNWFSSPEAQAALVFKVGDTRRRLIASYDALHSATLQTEEKLSVIYNEMHLEDRTTFISNRLRELVDQDLNLRTRYDNLLDDDSLIKNLVTRSSNSLLRSLSPEGDFQNAKAELVNISTDLSNARLTAITNIKDFFNHWGDEVVGSMKHIQEVAGPSGFKLPESDPAWDEFHRLCILSLNFLDVSSSSKSVGNEIRRLCQNKEYKVYKNRRRNEVMVDDFGWELRASFDRLVDLPPVERLCTYRSLHNRAEVSEMIRRTKVKN